MEEPYYYVCTNTECAREGVVTAVYRDDTHECPVCSWFMSAHDADV